MIAAVPIDGDPCRAPCGGPGPAGRTRLACAITEVLAPAYLACAQVVLVGWHTVRGMAGLAWGLLAATFCGLLPYGAVLAGVRRHRWTDRHLRTRQQRPVPLLVGIGSILVGLAVLVALGAPQPLVASVVAMLAGLATTLAVTLRWKVSLHAAAVSGTITILVLTFGSVLILAAPMIAAVGWSRVRLGDHTVAQVVVGAVLGALVGAPVFMLLR